MADNIVEEQTYTNQDQEEFSSVFIPIFSGLTNAYQESQVDSSCSCSLPIEAETVHLESVDQTSNSEPAEDQSLILPNKQTRLTDLTEDGTMVEVMVADWLNSTSSNFVRQMFYKIRHNYGNIKILARKLTRKPYGLMIVSSLLKYTVLNNLTYELLTHNQNKYTIS